VSKRPASLSEVEQQIASGQLQAAATSLQSLCASPPGDTHAWFLLGACRHALGEFTPALQAFSRALEIDPGHQQAALAEVAVLCQSGNPQAGLAQARRWIETHAGDVQMLYSAGLACQLHNTQAGDLSALEYYEQALSLDPVHPAALQNRGLVLTRLDRAEDAVENNRRFVAACPTMPEAHHNLVESCLAARHYEDLIAAADAALALSPGHAPTQLNRGYALAALDRLDEAQQDLKAALRGDDGTLRERFFAWAKQAGFGDAADMHALFQAEDLFVMAGYERVTECDWDGYEAFVARCTELVATAPEAALQSRGLAFNLLNLPIAAGAQRRLAERIAEGIAVHAGSMPQVPRTPRQARSKLRIGYVSSDFSLHPTSRMTLQLYGLHDRRRFEVYGYALSADDGSTNYAAIRRGCDRFINVEACSTADIARRIAADGIDILVDLNGYNRNGRSEIFALRSAPVQVGYTAYTATLGGRLLDYIIADHTVIPPGAEAYYAEQVVRLPHCYVPTSMRRLPALPAPSRRECGLPETGTVFCAFNRHEKIDPRVFGAWMRILARVPGSVLWLQAGPGETNLRRHAAAAGIAPQRLVFAAHLEVGAYVARLRLADLYLDTLNWNTHTQGVDALWAGVPIITCPGEHWVSRLASGLLRPIGLEDCIVADLQQYEALACELATQPEKLAALKARLARNRDTQPLFDIERVAGNLEDAYSEMWRIHASGAAPRSFDVPDAAPR
jgi:predicted O-linked N-acetylglucosamine transferase (SPINDLY family)